MPCYITFSMLTGTVFVLCTGLTTAAISQQIDSIAKLPINAEKLMEDHPLRRYGRGFPGTIRNRLSIDQIRDSIGQHDNEIVVDLSKVAQTLDGQRLDPDRIYGSLVCGPYPFEASEAEFAYPRFRRESPISHGVGLVDVGYFLSEKTNSEGWTDV